MPIKIKFLDLQSQEFCSKEFLNEIFDKVSDLSIEIESSIKFRISCIDGRYSDYLAERVDGRASASLTHVKILGGVSQVPK